MCRIVTSLSSIFFELFLLDREELEFFREGRCPECSSALHAAHFRRKLRGLPIKVTDEAALRLSLCCSREGCRRRVTPPSARFFGRRVYVGLVFLLASILTAGLSPHSLKKARDWFGVDRRTLKRWRTWWAERFVQTAFWRAYRGSCFATTIDETQLPRSLVHAFKTESRFDRLRKALLFLKPLTGGIRSSSFHSWAPLITI